MCVMCFCILCHRSGRCDSSIAAVGKVPAPLVMPLWFFTAEGLLWCSSGRLLLADPTVVQNGAASLPQHLMGLCLTFLVAVCDFCCFDGKRGAQLSALLLQQQQLLCSF